MKHLKKFNEISTEQELELMNIFSEKGWNLVDKKVDFYNKHTNKNISGKSGIIKGVKNEIATIDIDGEEYEIPFKELLDKDISKIHKEDSPFKSGPGFEYKTIDDYPQSIRLVYNRFSSEQKKSIDDNLESFSKVAKKLFYKNKNWKDFFSKETKKLKNLSEIIDSMNSWNEKI